MISVRGKCVAIDIVALPRGDHTIVVALTYGIMVPTLSHMVSGVQLSTNIVSHVSHALNYQLLRNCLRLLLSNEFQPSIRSGSGDIGKQFNNRFI